MMRVSELYRYPLKSLAGLSLKHAVIDDFGFVEDRRLMLVDDHNRFVTQRTLPALSLIDVRSHQKTYELMVDGRVLSKLSADLCEIEQMVDIWGESVEARTADASVTAELSEFLGQRVRLCHMPVSSFRRVDPAYVPQKQRTSFTDGYPFLIITQASLDDLNSRIDTPVSMLNFRPNIVIEGTSAYEEDLWKRIKIGGVTFELVKPCSRCVMTTVGRTGEKHREPLATLAQYRKTDLGVCFGQNAIHDGEGEISVGDLVKVI